MFQLSSFLTIANMLNNMQAKTKMHDFENLPAFAHLHISDARLLAFASETLVLTQPL